MTTAPPTPTDGTATSSLFCFGFGYTAGALAHRLAGANFKISGTRRSIGDPPVGVHLAAFDGTIATAEARTLLADATHVLVSVPPQADGDPVLTHFHDDLACLARLKWVGYLSTIGVYGDAGGDWVDETSPVRPTSERGQRRAAAEAGWRTFSAKSGKRVEIFRLPGIYGPGRSVIDSLLAGTARRVVKPGQVFNRVHVDDIAAALSCAMDMTARGKPPGFDTFNVVDDEPAPPHEVVEFAANLLSVAVPPQQAFESANLSPMGRSFYGENKRVRNARMKSALQIELAFPTYREGLRSILARRP
jgi:nucleoside-diphosphate-sugar epimerase